MQIKGYFHSWEGRFNQGSLARICLVQADSIDGRVTQLHFVHIIISFTTSRYGST